MTLRWHTLGLYRLYVLIDPRNSEAFYVGQTTRPQDRVDQHNWDAHVWKRANRWHHPVGCKINEGKSQRIAEIHDAGECVFFKVVGKYLSRKDVTRDERRLIDLLAHEPWRSALIVDGLDPFSAPTSSLTNLAHNPKRKRAVSP